MQINIIRSKGDPHTNMNPMWSNNMLLLLILLCFSCEKDPEIPSDIPEIVFKDFTFIEKSEPWGRDTLKVTFLFKNSGNDLGLKLDEREYPYHYMQFFYLENNRIKSVYNDHSRSDLLKIGDVDSLPPYNCNNYVIHRRNGISDTLYVKRNLFYYNLLCELYVEDGTGFKLFDFTRQGLICNVDPLHSRFPVLRDWTGKETKYKYAGYPFSTTIKGPHHGEMTYYIESPHIKDQLSGKNIKLKLNIIDRKFNISNTIETPALSIP